MASLVQISEIFLELLLISGASNHGMITNRCPNVSWNLPLSILWSCEAAGHCRLQSAKSVDTAVT